jgi:hypothetical protein
MSPARHTTTESMEYFYTKLTSTVGMRMGNSEIKKIMLAVLAAALIVTTVTISYTELASARGCEKNGACGQDPDPGEALEEQKEAADAAAEANEPDVD